MPFCQVNLYVTPVSITVQKKTSRCALFNISHKRVQCEVKQKNPTFLLSFGKCEIRFLISHWFILSVYFIGLKYFKCE